MLITPETSEERIRLIDEHTDGFIYMVSSAAITGAQKDFNAQKRRRYAARSASAGTNGASKPSTRATRIAGAADATASDPVRALRPLAFPLHPLIS